MSFKTISTTIALLLAAGAATAQTVSAGDAQLAASAGVQPGVYSTAQMVQLVEARRDNDAAQVRFILGQTGADASRSSYNTYAPVGAVSGLSAAEEIQLNDALRDDDRAAANLLRSGNKSAPAPASVVTPGEAQLAALIGVDPADYTLSELVTMQPSTTDF